MINYCVVVEAGRLACSCFVDWPMHGLGGASLARIATNLKRDWRPLLSTAEFPDEGLDEVVAEVMRDVRERKREIEAAPFGQA